jgi:hypothetical protein
MSERATKAEVEERIRIVEKMLAQGYTKSMIKRFFRETYDIRARQCERYVSEARRRLLEETKIDRGELIAQSFEFYMSVLRSTEATVKEKLDARRKADELLGLIAPRKIAPTNADGDQTYGAAVMAELMQLAEIGEPQIIDVDFVKLQIENDLAARETAGQTNQPSNT